MKFSLLFLLEAIEVGTFELSKIDSVRLNDFSFVSLIVGKSSGEIVETSLGCESCGLMRTACYLPDHCQRRSMKISKCRKAGRVSKLEKNWKLKKNWSIDVSRSEFVDGRTARCRRFVPDIVLFFLSFLTRFLYKQRFCWRDKIHFDRNRKIFFSLKIRLKNRDETNRFRFYPFVKACGDAFSAENEKDNDSFFSIVGLVAFIILHSFSFVLFNNHRSTQWHKFNYFLLRTVVNSSNSS